MLATQEALRRLLINLHTYYNEGKMVSDVAEKAVRDYLTYLVDPDAFKPDTTEIDQRIVAEPDMLEKLKLYSERLTLLDVGSTLRAGFIEHALSWSKENDVAADAFIQAGIPRSVLEEAKLVPKTSRRRQVSSKRVKTVKDTVASYEPGTIFTYSDVVQDSGGLTMGTIYNSMKGLVDEGIVADDGLAPRVHDKGRFPRQFKKVK